VATHAWSRRGPVEGIGLDDVQVKRCGLGWEMIGWFHRAQVGSGEAREGMIGFQDGRLVLVESLGLGGGGAGGRKEGCNSEVSFWM
jgi:hypothetical protein